ncbi:MAG: hypothetical protein Q4F34_01250, partial [Prevotellaceae bacterium]|nr:hypothetical protein [Prevotellaceae bacterium]
HWQSDCYICFDYLTTIPKVANLGGNSGTRAAKTGWEEGDKINIWFDDLDVISLVGDHIGRAELTLTYNGTSWDAAFDEYYAKHPQGLLYTLDDSHAPRILSCFYEGGNSIEDYYAVVDNEKVNNYTSQPIYKFYPPTKNDVPITPLMCAADHVDYTFDGETISATIDGWMMLTKVQVVVSGLNKDNASNYTLSCDHMYNIPYAQKIHAVVLQNAEYGWFEFYPDDDENLGKPTCGVSNADGVAFCFCDVEDPDGPFTFTLNDGESEKTFTAYTGVETFDEKVKFIKIAAKNFK